MQFDHEPAQNQSSQLVDSTLTFDLPNLRFVAAVCVAVLLSTTLTGCDPSQPEATPENVPTASSPAETETADSKPRSSKESAEASVAATSGDKQPSMAEAAEKVQPATKAADSEDKPKEVVEAPVASAAADASVRILAWNIESNGANPDVIAKQLGEMDRYDIYGFSEVRASGFPAIKAALGKNYFYKFTKSGFDDRLAFAINLQRFDVVDHYEFNTFKGHMINPGNYRAPFVVELKDKTNGESFLVVLNHLARGKAEIRQEQALAIRMWAKAEGKPIIAIGDYNFDYVFDTDKGNRAMDVFLEDGTFKWIRPVPMVDSNYYDEDKDGVDDYIDSLLDFAFAAGEAKNWKMDCQVVVRDGDFPDDEQTSDHRPVQLIIQR